METGLYLFVLGLAFFLMMRMGCGAHATGHGRHGSSHAEGSGRLSIPTEARDPVCGMIVATASAKPTIHRGAPYFFCSAQCRDRFEAEPAKFLETGGSQSHSMEHRHA